MSQNINKARAEVHRRLTYDLPYFAREAPLMIKDKLGKIVPMQLNAAQMLVHNALEKQLAEKGFVRALILKGRQQGMSTYVNARFYHKTRRGGINTFILSHEASTTDKLFKMVKRFHENVHPSLKPETSSSSRKELVFNKIESEYFIGTAGNPDVGRGGTLQLFHGCVAEDSLVILSDGSSVPIKDIKVGDTVVTSSGAIAPVSLKTNTGKKQVYKISTWMTNEFIEVSADHKILTDRGWLKLSEVKESDYVQLPDIKISGDILEKKFELPSIERKQGGGSKHINFANVALDYNAGYFFGYYLAEGHIKKQWGSERHHAVQFCCHENEDYMAPVFDFALKFATSFKEVHIPKQHKKVTTFCGTFLAEMTREWFGRVESKNIPSWVFDCSHEFVLGLIDGYYLGDGSKTEARRVRAPSIHEKISRQLKRLVNAVTDGVCGLHKYERSRYGFKTKDIYVSAINGRAWEQLFGSSCGKLRNERFKVVDGKKFVKIRSIEATRIVDTWDIEVDHPDHDFETPVGIISNSECHFWPNTDEIESGVMESVPSGYGEIILESTANGMSGMFFEKCMAALHGKGDYQLIFVPWFLQEEYRREVDKDFQLSEDELTLQKLYNLDLEQLCWRRYKIDNAKNGLRQFQQEYPCNVMEAFQTSGTGLINPENVLRARKSKIKDVQAPLIIGVDPSGGREGRDSTTIVFRRGREVPVIIAYPEMSPMRLAGILSRAIDKYSPAKVYVDYGYGHAIVDRLHELGYNKIVHAVQFGESAIDSKLYLNKRVEMWCEVRDWLKGEVNIPDDEGLHADLTIMPDYITLSNGKIKLIGKDEIKQKLKRSPDKGDALALTFAYPVRANINDDQQKVRRKPSALKNKLTKKEDKTQKVIISF